MDCYLPDLPSFLVIQWSLTTVDESPQFLALSPPLMFMSRQIPTTCHVRFEEISSKRSFFQNPSKCKTHYSKVQSARNNNSLGFPSKVSGYYVDMDHVVLSLQLRLLLQA